MTLDAAGTEVAPIRLGASLFGRGYLSAFAHLELRRWEEANASTLVVRVAQISGGTR
jgi:hypothetical protein